MPVVAPYGFQNEKAGGAFENAAEEILNGIFCHYEPPASTKEQKVAADAVRETPTKFLYEEQQPTKPSLRKKKKKKTPALASKPKKEEAAEDRETQAETQKEEEREDPPTRPSVKEIVAAMTKASIEQEIGTRDEAPQPAETRNKKRMTWRDEKSKRREEELPMEEPTTNFLDYATVQCGSGFELPFIGRVGGSAPEE